MQMGARCSSIRWRRRWPEPGRFASSALRRWASFARRLAAAARVKVTMSSRSASTGFSSRQRMRTARSTSTAVLPLPAAALTSRALPVWSMARLCWGVNLMVAIDCRSSF